MKKKEECKKHDKESECGDCGKKFYLIPKNESSDFTTKKMEEFDKIFVNENLWKSNNEDTAFVGIGNIKSFLSQSLQQARQHERELIKEKLSKMKKKTCDCENDEGLGYHTKECDFTPYGYNQALDDIINNLL